MSLSSKKSRLGIVLTAVALLVFGCGDDNDDSDNDNNNNNNNPANSNNGDGIPNPFGDLNVEELAACNGQQLETGSALFEAVSEALGVVGENFTSSEGGTFTVEGENGGTAVVTMEPLEISSITNLATGTSFTIEFTDFGTPPNDDDEPGPTVTGTTTGQFSTSDIGTSFMASWTADVVLDGSTEVEMNSLLDGLVQTTVFTIDGEPCNLSAGFDL